MHYELQIPFKVYLIMYKMFLMPSRILSRKRFDLCLILEVYDDDYYIVEKVLLFVLSALQPAMREKIPRNALTSATQPLKNGGRFPAIQSETRILAFFTLRIQSKSRSLP